MSEINGRRGRRKGEAAGGSIDFCLTIFYEESSRNILDITLKASSLSEA